MALLVLGVQNPREVLRAPELSDLAVSFGQDDTDDEGLDLSHVFLTDRQVDAEPVPRVTVAVVEVVLQSSPQVRGEADLVEALASVEGVYPVAASDVRADKGLVLLEEFAGDALQVLTDELLMPRHAMGSRMNAEGVAAADLPGSLSPATKPSPRSW